MLFNYKLLHFHMTPAYVHIVYMLYKMEKISGH